jgi:hypothetical protein
MENDSEVRRLIRRWAAPAPSQDLDRRMMARYRSARGWRGAWRRFLRARLSLPVPALAAALLLAACLLLLSSRKPDDARERMAGFEPVAAPHFVVARAEAAR